MTYRIPSPLDIAARKKATSSPRASAARGVPAPAATRVYVSGPYSRDPDRYVEEAITVADRLLRAGLAPLVPHLKHPWVIRYPHAYEDWIRVDLAWVQAADVVLRLPGESPGADREVAHARACGVPVMYSVEELLAWLGRAQPADGAP